jgi:putative transposase
MPRRNRIHIAGMPLHIVQRGHNRDACFFGEQDYLAYQHWLLEVLNEQGCALHAYVLMTNHVHLLITPTRAEAISQLVMSLGRKEIRGQGRVNCALIVAPRKSDFYWHA